MIAPDNLHLTIKMMPIFTWETAFRSKTIELDLQESFNSET
jgi:hypothetical protein